ncbi:MAG: hypothetical protein ABEJ65_12030 [bacterium]
MWQRALIIGFFVGVFVFGAGVMMNLGLVREFIKRGLFSGLGTFAAIMAAHKAINIFVNEGDRSQVSTETSVDQLDLNQADSVENEVTEEESTKVDDETEEFDVPEEESTDEEQLQEDLVEDEESVEEIADLISDQME